MSTPLCTAHPYHYEHAEQVVELLRTTFLIDIDTETFRHKYERHPSKLNLSTVLLSRETVVGFLGHVPKRFSLQKREVLAAVGTDVCIAEPHRSLNNLLTMSQVSSEQLREASVELLYGVPLPEMREINIGLFNFVPVAPVPAYVKPLRYGGWVRERLAGIKGRTLGWGLDTLTSLRPAPAFPKLHDMKVDEVSSFGAECHDLLAHVRNSQTVHRILDPDTLNWQAAPGPNQRSKRLQITDTRSGNVIGILIVTERIIGQRKRGRLQECIVHPDVHDSLQDAMLRLAVHTCWSWGCETVDLWAGHAQFSKTTLNRIGFRSRSRPDKELHAQALSPLRDDTERIFLLSQPDAWPWSMGLSDEA